MLAMSVLERLSYVVTILDRWQVLAVSGCHCRDLLLKDLSGTVQNYWQICFIVVEPETCHNSRWHYKNGVPNRLWKPCYAEACVQLLFVGWQAWLSFSSDISFSLIPYTLGYGASCDSSDILA